MAPPAENIPPVLEQGSPGRAATGVPTSNPRRPLPQSALALLALTAALTLARLTENLNLPILHCTFKSLTGLPCPFCGGTRSFRSLTHLDFIAAVHFNPLAVIAAFTFAAAALLHLTLPRTTTNSWREHLQRVPFLKLLIPLTLLNWLYLILFLPR